MPWRRLPTDRARRRRLHRRLWLIAAVLFIFAVAALLIWFFTVWTTPPLPE